MALTYTNKLNTQGGSSSPYGPALQNKIQGPKPLQPVKNSILGNVASGISSYWNNTGPGRFHNPQSPDYTAQPQSAGIIPTANAQAKTPVKLPTMESFNNSFMKSNPQYSAPSTQGGQMKGSMATPLATPIAPSSPTPTPAVTPPQPVAPQTTFGGLVGSLANTQSSPYNQSAEESIRNINATAKENKVYADRAREIADTAGQKISDIGGQGARAEAGYSTTGTSPVAEGNAAVIAQTTAAQQRAVAEGANVQLLGNAQGLTAQGQAQSGFNSAAGQALSGQGQVQGALGTAAGFAAPQPYGLTTQPYNPLSDTYGGGSTGGAINRATQAANIGTAQEFQTKINTTQALAGAADANFEILNSYAAQGGASNDAPIITSITKRFGQTVQGNEAVAGFQAQLQNLRAAYTEITGGDAIKAIPNNITPAQLKQVQATLKNTAQNNIASYQKGLSGLSNPTNQNNSTQGKWSW